MRNIFSGKVFDIDSYVHFTTWVSSEGYSGSLSGIDFVDKELTVQLQ